GAAIAVLSHRSGFLALPAVLWAGAHAWRRAERPARARALLAGAALLAAVAAMLPPSLDTLLHFDRTVHLPGGAVAGARVGGGWARDWAVGTGAGVVAALASGAVLVRSWRSPGMARTLAPAATLALAVAASLWGVHASETIGSARLEELVRARPRLSDATR